MEINSSVPMELGSKGTGKGREGGCLEGGQEFSYTIRHVQRRTRIRMVDKCGQEPQDQAKNNKMTVLVLLRLC